MTNPSPAVLLGAGGHAKVVLALCRAAGIEVVAVCAPELAAPHWLGLRVLDSEERILAMERDQVVLLNGIGQMPRSSIRRRVYDKFAAAGFAFPPLVHPAAWVAPDVRLESGVQVMAGAIVQPASVIGANSVINTGAQVDHDCVIGGNVHVAPGAVLCGAVEVGDGAFIGAGAVVIQGRHIGADALVAAGAVVR